MVVSRFCTLRYRDRLNVMNIVYGLQIKIDTALSYTYVRYISIICQAVFVNRSRQVYMYVQLKQKKAYLKSVSSIRCTKQEFTQKLYVNTSVTNKIGWKPSNTPYSATTSRCSYVSHTIAAQSFVIFTCPFTHAFIIVLFGRLSNGKLVSLIVASTFSHIMMKRNDLC